MQSIVPYRSWFHLMALMHDRLGWRSFPEGRISTVLVQEMHMRLSTTLSLIGAADWAKGLVNHLICITHGQWKYRNDTTHFRVEGRIPDQHREVIQEMKRLMEVDPSTLLPTKYRHLFKDEDFAELGRRSATNRIFWISAAKSAIAASAIHRRRKNRKRRQLLLLREEQEASDTPADTPPAYPAPQLPIEPSIKYKKRRLK